MVLSAKGRGKAVDPAWPAWMAASQEPGAQDSLTGRPGPWKLRGVSGESPGEQLGPRTLRVEAGGGFGIAAAGRAAIGGAQPHFTDHIGPVIATPHLQLVFWGAGWKAAGEPSVGEVEAAAGTLVSGRYLAGLAEYRGIGPGKLLRSVLAPESEPPQRFSDPDSVRLLKELFEARRLPEPDDDSAIVYCVIMPSGVTYENANVIGQHSYFHFWDVQLAPFDVDLAVPCHYAWVTNDGTLDGITTVLSHELAEAVTDPQGTGILGDAGSCDGSGWCEIGDVCESQTGTCDGVTVQAYWSQRAGACVVPGS